ncbi:hypothetical protein HD806DRAFT_219718 [Xylariaceae sp. AK1471]|nr:hypothetical protein HD806DRAFT_219718 [Xylariaceae sp. AK1471]
MCQYGILAPRCIKCNKAITPSKPHATPGRRPRIAYCEAAWDRYRTATGLYTRGETASSASLSWPFFEWCGLVVGPEISHLRAFGVSPHEVMQLVQAGLLRFQHQDQTMPRPQAPVPLPLPLAISDYRYRHAHANAYSNMRNILATGLRILESAGPIDVTRSELSAGPWQNILTGEMETGYPSPVPELYPEPFGANSPLTAPMAWLACRPPADLGDYEISTRFSETTEWVDGCVRCDGTGKGAPGTSEHNPEAPAAPTSGLLLGNSPADWLKAEANEWRVYAALQPEAYAKACASKGEDILADYE